MNQVLDNNSVPGNETRNVEIINLKDNINVPSIPSTAAGAEKRMSTADNLLEVAPRL